jgi:hypothetical protein
VSRPVDVGTEIVANLARLDLGFCMHRNRLQRSVRVGHALIGVSIRNLLLSAREYGLSFEMLSTWGSCGSYDFHIGARITFVLLFTVPALGGGGRATESEFRVGLIGRVRP